MPQFDLADPAGVMADLRECRAAFPERYIRITAFDSTRGWETVRMSFIVGRPTHEPGFGLVRREAQGRSIRYTVHPYATDRPEGERYQ
jgi:ribulose-bisphosphate carboxylase small chain